MNSFTNTNLGLSNFSNVLKQTYYKLLEHKIVTITFIFIFFTLLINSLHTSYPDEFENIVGGYFILHGRLPYTGFFTHHGPFAYFFAAIIGIFSGGSFVNFRILLAVAYFILHLSFYFYIKYRFGLRVSHVILVFSLFLALCATYVWGHMLLADSLVGLLLIPAYIITFLIILKNEALSVADSVLISLLAFSTLLTSLTFVYAIMFLYIFTIYWWIKTKTYPFISKQSFRFYLILTTPYILFLIYLIVTNSLFDYYYQAIFFNQAYYLEALPSRNPLRLAIVILYSFLEHYRAILAQVKDLNFGTPMPHTLALANLLMIIYLIVNKKIASMLFLIAILVYVNVRSNPYSTSETDYQGIPYHYLSLFNGIFLIALMWQDLKDKLDQNKKIIYSFFLILLGAYFLFLFLFLLEQAGGKAYKKYMGTQSTIYDRPAVAPTLNKLLDKNDFYYIGPFAFEDHLYMKSRLASRYFVTIPAMDKSDKIKTELLEDIKKNKPKIVVFDTEFTIFGSTPGKYLVNYLRDNYFILEQLHDEKSMQKFTVAPKLYGDYELERHFFFDKSRKDELIRKLIDEKIIILQ